jgi:hypothetical protein
MRGRFVLWSSPALNGRLLWDSMMAMLISWFTTRPLGIFTWSTRATLVATTITMENSV